MASTATLFVLILGTFFLSWAIKLLSYYRALGLGLWLVLLAALRGTAAIPRRLGLWVQLLGLAVSVYFVRLYIWAAST